VLLLDLMMPGMTGLEVMDYIKQHELDVTVIVVSGDSSVSNAIHSIRRGAHDFLRKPYAPELLVRTVENAIEKRLLENENRSIQGRLEHSEKLYRYMVNSSPDIIYMLDPKGCFTFINDRIESLLGYKKDELIGQHYSELVFPEDLKEAGYVFNERRTGERASRNVEMRLRCKDSACAPRHFETDTLPIVLSSLGMYVIPEEGEDESYVGTYGVARDITDRKHAEEIIHYQAFHDLLTGLPNRALFKDRLKLSISQAHRREQQLAVMFLDLDRFKLVNDTLGHVRGDELLQLVATRLVACMREGDTIARVGGDEFMILIPEVTGEADVTRTAQKIIKELEQPFVLEGHEVFVSTSIGISMFPEHGDSQDTLIKNADIAMYHIKEEGRDGYEYFNDEMKAKFSHFLTLEAGIHKALAQDQLSLVYQPQIDTLSGRVIGVEALIRWQHPTRGLLAPAEFIPHAEECGLIIPVGDWVLKQACLDLADWRRDGLDSFRLAINLSALQLAHKQVDGIAHLLEEYNIPGEALEVEITENVIMKDIDRVVKKLTMLSRHGVQVAIDDFGTGYSSLAYLQKLPINTIKIDRSFVADMGRENGQNSIVNAIIAMANGLHMKIVAEGVETEEQLKQLQMLGCSVIQGFLISKPMPAEELKRWLRFRVPSQLASQVAES
jgi:diguanylate cyclase (GGDEF)-like protein/PAS domain S-box-containing protein